MFLAPVRVLEVSPPRPRKKERRIASHRVSPRPVCFPSPAGPCLSFPPSPSRLLLCCVSGVEPTREHQFFSAPSDVCLFSSPPSPPPPFSGSFASVGFPRSWLCHLVPDGRSFPHAPPSSLGPIARIFDHGAFRAFGPGTRRERLPFFSPGVPSVPRCRSRS